MVCSDISVIPYRENCPIRNQLLILNLSRVDAGKCTGNSALS